MSFQQHRSKSRPVEINSCACGNKSYQKIWGRNEKHPQSFLFYVDERNDNDGRSANHLNGKKQPDYQGAWCEQQKWDV